MNTLDVKSMLVGFLLCTVGFLTIGATNTDMNGRFQLSTCTNNTYVEETIMDTMTGEIISRESMRVKGHYKTNK